MLSVSNALSFVFAILMVPFWSLPLTGMIVISVLTGILMLIIYKYTSNQDGITRAKNKIKSNFLAIMLFKDSLRVLVKSIGRIFAWNLVYMGHNLKPLAVMIVPVLLLLVQLNFFYGYRPVHIGEQVLVNVKTAPGLDLDNTRVSLSAYEGVKVKAGGVRIPMTGEITWRVEGVSPGEHDLTIQVGTHRADKKIVVSDSNKLFQLAPLRHDGNFWDGLLYPGEKKLSGEIRSVEVAYPTVEMNIFGWHLHWIIVYFILSILFGFSMKGIFHVDI